MYFLIKMTIFQFTYICIKKIYIYLYNAKLSFMLLLMETGEDYIPFAVMYTYYCIVIYHLKHIMVFLVQLLYILLYSCVLFKHIMVFLVHLLYIYSIYNLNMQWFLCCICFGTAREVVTYILVSGELKCQGSTKAWTFFLPKSFFLFWKQKNNCAESIKNKHAHNKEKNKESFP